MKAGLVSSLFALLAIAGCAALLTEYEEPYTGLTVPDVLAMSEAGVTPEIIIRKIEVSDSAFHLDTDDVIRLRRAGVHGDVIAVMLGANEEARQADLEQGYSFYEYWFDYYNTHYPSVLPFNRFFPTMQYSYGPYLTSRYRWTGDGGVYYRDFPVGLPGKYRGRYPRSLREAVTEGMGRETEENDVDDAEK